MPAVVATQQWYVGPGEQHETVLKGYDEGYEDQLFEQIEWPVDGYRLFEIGHFIGGRDWFDGQWESNCIFVPASLLDQVGAMDHDFNAPGRRLREPGLLRAHDDLAAHQPRDDPRRGLVPSGARRHDDEHAGDGRAQGAARLLRRSVRRAAREGVQVTRRRSCTTSAPCRTPLAAPRRGAWERRSTSSSRTSTGHRRAARRSRFPCPEELRTEFVDAFWRSKEWQQTPWLGSWTAQAADRPDRVPGAHHRRAAGLHHRDRHRRRRARLLPRHDLRPARPRARDLDRRLPRTEAGRASPDRIRAARPGRGGDRGGGARAGRRATRARC